MLRLTSVVIRQGAFRLRADWAVAAGARVAVIGPSGAGKSTLLMAIAGFFRLNRVESCGAAATLRDWRRGTGRSASCSRTRTCFRT